MTISTRAGETAAGRTPDAVLRLDELHGSVSDPLLDAMNFLNEVVSRHPGAISFAPGRPYEGSFEVDSIVGYLTAYLDHLRESGFTADQIRTNVFQYGRTNGHIHHLIARTVANDEGIEVDPAAIVVTVGAQEGMLLALRTLMAGPDDVLLVSSPCYVGISGAARLLDVEVVPVPERPDGVDPAAVEATAREARARGKRPRAMYVVPDFANPSGISMTVDARRELLAVAAREDLLILEDNPYGFFLRAGEPRPTIKSMDRHRRVVYLGTFAKTCFPGARVGYLLADQTVAGPDGHRVLADEISKVKSMTTVNTSALSQAVIGGMLVANGCRLRAANTEATGFYRANLQTILDELERRFPAEARERLGVGWNVPDGGFFLVVRVPFETDEAALERSARDYRVLWTPMRDFYLDGGGARELRLSCSALLPAQIREGIGRLADFITDSVLRLAMEWTPA